uniref:CD109 antigen n=1 Tax=Pristiophorus japonicus TaxID=55135 RepID=UPI00398F2808
MTPLTRTLSVAVQLLLSLLSTCTTSGPSYIITAPRRLSPRLNMTFTVCPLQGSQSPLRITAQISKDGQNPRRAEGTFHPGTIGRLVLPTEGLPESHYELVVQGYAEETLLFSNSSSMEVIADRVSTLIQTDKAMYKPGQTVRIRIICIYPDLKPYLGQINVTIRSPQMFVIQQWLDLNTTLGVVSKEFPLSSNSPLGHWNIQVTSNGVQRVKSFTVAEYVFSRFEVWVNTSSVYFPLDQEDITGTITGRYLYGKPVKGNVSIIISLPEVTSTLNKTFEMNGTANFIFPFPEIQRFILKFYRAFMDLTDTSPGNHSDDALMEQFLALVRYQVYQLWDSYEIITNIVGKPDRIRVGTFITAIGRDALDIHNNLPYKSEEDKQNVEIILKLWEEHCKGKTNIIYERYQFNNCVQGDMWFYRYLVKLRELASSCDFSNLRDDFVRDRIVCAISDNILHKRLLQDSSLTLDKCVMLCKVTEATVAQVKSMKFTKTDSEDVKATRQKARPTKKESKDIEVTNNCRYCGKRHELSKTKCPAYRKIYTSRSKQNHFSQKCRSNDLSELLRRLTHKGRVWKWTEEQDKVFEAIKQHVTDSPVHRYFDHKPKVKEMVRARVLEYGFNHPTSSPEYPQSNGKVENAVKLAKWLTKNTKVDYGNFYMNLLICRQTPTEGLDSSSPQCLLGRHTKTSIAIANELLKLRIIHDVIVNKGRNHAKQAHYYNRGATALPTLQEGETVRLKQMRENKEWQKVQVQKRVSIQSYQIIAEDGRVMQFADANITISFMKYNLKIVSYQRILKPPLNYTSCIQVTRSDHRKLSPQDRENLMIVDISQTQSLPSELSQLFSRKPSEHNDVDSKTWEISSQTINLTVPESGLLKIQFPLLPNTISLWIKMTFEKVVREIQVSNNVQSSSRPILQLHIQSSVVKVGLPFEFTIESSELLNEITYQVVSRGHVVATGKSSSDSLELMPDLSWAPVASLIVYYVQQGGQVVSDSLNLDVEGIFSNKVSLSWSKDQTKPADNVSLSLSTNESSSFVGILVVDKSIQLLKGGNDITEELVIQELKDAVKEYIFPDNGGMYSVDAFQDIGLMVITDAYIPSNELLYEILFDADIQFRKMGQSIEPEEERVRTYFPETWIWLDMLTGPNSTVSFQRTVPDSLTTWIASAFAISQSHGLQLAAAPALLEVFKPFFFELNLPYSVTRGEQLILEINIFNYLQQTLEVWVTVELSDAFDFTIIPDKSNTVPNNQTESVLSQDAHVFYFPITLKGLGKIPITVKASSAVAVDAVTKHILVKAEGIQRSYSQALFVAPKVKGQLWSEVVQYTFPKNVVDGSQIAHVTVIGDILGSSINGIEDLLQMPYGCGEQNMIKFAPNIYILQYLRAINQVNEEIEEKAVSYMIQGYQRELTYQRADGSFSAFGNSDSSGSTWLSAFVLRCFLQAQDLIYIDTGVLDGMMLWIMSHQNEKGEFWEPGRVIHTELQGGQNGPTSLTAYVLTALLEDRGYMDKTLDQVSDAVSYLERKLQDGISSNYTLSLVTYALTLAKSIHAEGALDELNDRADQQAGVRFWSSPTNRPSTWWGQQPLSSDIEVASYALLSHLRQDRLSAGIPVMQWLSQRRNHLGGFSSTQDTVVALQALSQFAARGISSTTDLTMSISGPGLTTPAIFNVSSANAFVLQAVQIGIEQTMLVNITAQGQGMAIFQLNILFNLESKVASRNYRSVGSEEAFDLDIDVIDYKDDLNHVTLHICTRFRGVNSSSSGMVLMEVGMLSGFVPESGGVQTNDLIKKVEFEAGSVSLYFDSLNETEVCVTIPVARDSKVANAQDAVVSVFEYYEPGKVTVRTYNSKVMSGTDSCNFCGFNCSLCRSNFSPLTTSSAALPWRGWWTGLLPCLLGTSLGLP